MQFTNTFTKLFLVLIVGLCSQTLAFTYDRLDKTNAMLLVVDHQEGLFQMARDQVPSAYKSSILAHAALAKVFSLPTILTTSADTGPNGPLPEEIVAMHPNSTFIHRQGEVNAWDNAEFQDAVKGTGKKQVVLAGITTDVCTSFLALSLVEAGFSVFANADASGTFNVRTADDANDRMRAAGVQILSTFAVACELMRDWRATPGQVELLPFFDTYLPEYGFLTRAHDAAVLNGTVSAFHGQHKRILLTILKIRQDNEQMWFDLRSARRWVYELGGSVVGAPIKHILDAFSAVPTNNAFSVRLAKFGFNFYTMFAPDLLHEFELGVWKATFIHLLRILCAIGSDVIQTLNKRFRQVSTFGRDTIRWFSSNTSAMKKLAARDWEDILQCAIPVFEGLLSPECDAIVQDLLFVLASWHVYAKLRIHTDTTLAYFETSTAMLGQVLRRFKNMAKKNGKSTTGTSTGTGNAKTSVRRKKFNMATYKLHSRGDYLMYVQFFGTSDNYSTQVANIVEMRQFRIFCQGLKIISLRDFFIWNTAISNNRMYRHKVLRINYTTYDVRRAQDSLNPRTHSDIMMLAHEDNDNGRSQYWYAHIVRLFHVWA
ncbi:hypothetical protein EUX98_g8103 [Antrodiella citrinella]|uniref:Isochorismatase-like domain-containing protein n=1 Tax=Antrodiella citrinella TaxID=2447956 RepID=A0A4V3XGX9_9APHY|nr:hypothetical protein EUX98_g8103 [Antrodiella citrinella]